ncbi:MAG: phenylalanine--tRNA ligase subunit beta [Elusimicrobiota bacterium]|nr:phenylalanine--tRNA ligase subunit beta [Elusimicrobiota bacterium]
MRISYNWLKEYVDFSLSPPELAKCLTMAGLEVSDIVYLGSEVENVVVGEILSLKPVPQADKLSLCQVSDGKQIFSIVCGAMNIKVKDLVPLARVGAKLPGGRRISKAKIKGQTSCGMLCSEKELGLGEDASGILVLPRGSKLGADIKKALTLEEVVLEIELTTNRSDCASIFGMAREVSAILGGNLKPPRIELKENGVSVSDLAKVEILAPQACRRYTARIIRDVKVGSSPSWLVKKLETVGLRAINNVVDVTNYVLIELGHPLHAFDYDKLAEHKIVVRFATPGEKLLTLDNEERKLTEKNLLIADAKRPVALAGIIGGVETSVEQSTRNVLLESAYFAPQVVRSTARQLGIDTESSYRFERGVDVENLLIASKRACQLIQELAGGKIAAGVIDVYPQPFSPVEIEFSPEEADRILGSNISAKEMSEILSRLRFNVSQEEGEKRLQVRVPSYRNDISRSIDLVEEIARLYGYDKIPSGMPKIEGSGAVDDKVLMLEDFVKDVLTRLGLCEVVSRSLVSPEYYSELDVAIPSELKGTVEITNPLSREQSLLRTSLLPGLLSVVRWNLNHGVSDMKIFEIGRVFFPGKDVPQEKRILAGVLVGSQEERYWEDSSKAIDFYYVKGIVESLLGELGINSKRRGETGIKKSGHFLLEEGISNKITIDSEHLGDFGELVNEVSGKMEFRDKVYIFELDFDKLCGLMEIKKKYERTSRFPWVSRDIALVAPEGLTFGEICAKIKNAGRELVRDVKLFDIYFGKQIEPGKRGLACKIVYQSMEKTLKDEEVNSLHTGIVETLERDLKVKVRKQDSPGNRGK